MAIVRGLKSINKHIEDEEARFSGSDGPSTKWFKLNDKQTFKVLFLQELDDASPNYSEKNGLGFLAVEHVNPQNWRRKALCTADDGGQCFGCEQHRKDWKAGWKTKTRLYINVLVDEGNGTDPYVAVLSQGNGPKSVTPTLIEYASEDETITDKWFSIKRTGSGATDTSYLIRAGKAHDLNVEDYELFDLEKVVRNVDYDEQEAHYRQGEEGGSADAVASEAAKVFAGSSAGSASTDSEW